MQHILRHRDEIWLTQPGEIAAHVEKLPPARCRGAGPEQPTPAAATRQPPRKPEYRSSASSDAHRWVPASAGTASRLDQSGQDRLEAGAATKRGSHTALRRVRWDHRYQSNIDIPA